jgi:hypothetical protein
MRPGAKHTHSWRLKPNSVIFIRSPAWGPASFYHGAPPARSKASSCCDINDGLWILAEPDTDGLVRMDHSVEVRSRRSKVTAMQLASGPRGAAIQSLSKRSTVDALHLAAPHARANENVIFLIGRSRSVSQQPSRQQRFCRLHCASREVRHGPAMHKLGA